MKKANEHQFRARCPVSKLDEKDRKCESCGAELDPLPDNSGTFIAAFDQGEPHVRFCHKCNEFQTGE